MSSRTSLLSRSTRVLLLFSVCALVLSGCPLFPQWSLSIPRIYELDHGVITITVDDAPESTISRIYPILDEYGLKGNVALPIINVGKDNYLTLEDLQTLDLAGWSIVSHSMTHKNLTTLSDEELVFELEKSKEWIINHGFKGSSTFVVPFHYWEERELKAVSRVYTASRGLAVTARHSLSGGDRPNLENIPPDNPNLISAWPGDHFYKTSSGRDVTMKEIEKAIENQKFFPIYFHSVNEENVNDFRELIQRIAIYKQFIMTYHELFEEY